MVSPKRAVPLLVMGILSWGILSFWEPRELGTPPGQVPELAALYAAPLERVETHVLGRGETLSGLLARASIGGGELSNLLLALREHKSPRELREGSEITVRRWLADGAPRLVEVRLNADSTVRLQNGAEGWASDVVVTPTTIDTLFIQGAIEQGRTLSHALLEDDNLGDLPARERVSLVGELAEIYAYKLDFSRDIQPGDRYRLVYEREARPDGSARAGRILIAEMDNRGKRFPAIYFNARGVGGGYYDELGQSLRTGFRRSPLDYVRITSAFTWQRYHPVLGVYRAHLGTDYGAPTGTPVKATGDGTVIFAGRQGGYGNLVEIRHHGGYTTRYAHLSRFGSGIRTGRAVKQSEVIGYVGATGLATGPHLHYELRKNGQPLNGQTAKLPGAPPLPDGLRREFNAMLGQRMALLQLIDGVGPRLAKASAAELKGAGEES